MSRRYCERCERITQDGNRWCPFTDCPAETGAPVYEYGDYVGDLKITRLIRVWRWAVLYEAERNAKVVWVKIAHHNPECEDRLRREAKLLQNLRPRKTSSWSAQPRSMWPTLLPALPGTKDIPYGEITVLGQPKVFEVFAPMGGVLLADKLLENPQIWHQEAAWIAATIAEAMRPLAANNLSHLCLTPDVVQIEKDAEGHWRATLLDLGWLVDNRTTGASIIDILPQLVPAYTAPEVQSGNRLAAITPSADVYSLGMILREMLAGSPGYDPRLPRDEKVRREVVASRVAVAVGRPELEQAGVVGAVQNAVAPRERLTNVLEFAKVLNGMYGPPPPEKRPLPAKTRLVSALVIVLLLVLAGVAAYLLLSVLR